MSKINSTLRRVDQSLLKEHQRIDREFFIEHNNVYELFNARVKMDPKKIFAIFPEYKKEFSYEDLHRHVIERAQYLKKMAILRGEKMALVIPNSPDFILMYLAALKEGIVVVPINPDLTALEISYVISNSLAKVVFYSEQFDKKIREVKKSLDPAVSFTDVSTIRLRAKRVGAEVSDVAYTDEAVIIYTSGTTGNPKGVVLTHLNILSDSSVIATWFQFTRDTRTLCILPLFHNNGQVITLFAPLQAGGSTVMVSPKTNLLRFWYLVKRFDVNWTSVMTAILSIILSIGLKREDSSMVGIICGGQVLSPELQKKFENTYHVPIFEGFGLTETTSFSCFNRFPAKNRVPGSVGRALPCNDMKIVDGEICIRGLNVLKEYYRLDDINKNALRDGWFHTGDFGEIDADGNIYFKTRKDYLIIKGGENIYPSEIENALFAHAAVDECAAIGVPDDLLGQHIVAFVKLKKQCTEADLKEFLTDKLAHYKHPKRIFDVSELEALDDIPKGPTKKVLYRSLLVYYNEHLME